MTDDRELRDYLAALEQALGDVPRDGRAEVLRDVRGHVEETRADEPDLPVRAVLDRLGTPAAVAAEARERYGTVPPRRGPGAMEVAAVVLLLVGGIVVPVLGWVVGVVLLWASPRWRIGDKLLGTFVFPLGLGFPLFGGVAALRLSSGTCVTTEVVDPVTGVTTSVDVSGSGCGDPSLLDQVLPIAVLVVGVLAPLFVAVHLLRRARRAA